MDTNFRTVYDCIPGGVTADGVSYRTGIFSKQDWTSLPSTLQYVDVHQSFFGRILGYGSVLISFDGNRVAKVRGIQNPQQFADMAKRGLSNDG